ncbi:MAG: NADH-quinone oxidoreductase subunit N [Puniceicoccaceae bacterium MED-G31]|nr:NADH-quinone oxidoreductase subunit N [Coraliomargarita sp.]PDH30209.1 MAG: NADH-quinone oxidoreductase subunit N [Puniceicoccaceae bacterium MED-G31]HBO57890.1 NADH-quinone oxidoreductase subunit N [Opitutae bacterium]|tara:strand:- start:5891 stop:7396 length:1506 start_codon:yes stop_codon:yes gene_type:complete
MNDLLIDFLRGFTNSNDWSALLPEVLLALLALVILVADIVLPKGKCNWIYWVSIVGQLAILVLIGSTFAIVTQPDSNVLFGGLIEQTSSSQWMRGFFSLSALFITYIGRIYLSKHTLAHTEFYHLVLIVAAGMMLLVQSSHFIMLFVALETVTVAFYVLVAYGRTSSLSLEAGLKYLILGAMSSALLLFGIVLLYGVAGNPLLSGATGDSLNYNQLSTFIELNASNLLVQLGALLVLAGLFFKIGAFPFQIWVPDVYQGSPTPVTAYLAVASKAAGFSVLLVLVNGPFLPLSEILIPVLSVIAGATILFGNIAATSQRNVKRLMGLSGIAHAGYLLVGVVASLVVPWAYYAVLFYLFNYLFASFAVFGVMAITADSCDANQQLDDYRDLGRTQPFLGGVLAFGLGSLAGIPPLGGFIAKLFLLFAAFEAGLYSLLFISICGVVISIYYYFAWIREVFFSVESSDQNNRTVEFSTADSVVLAIIVVAIVLVGVYPGVLPLMQ